MSSVIKPILSSLYGTEDINISESDNQIKLGTANLITSESSSVRDIIEFNHYPVKLSVLNSWLSYLGFSDLINSFIINDSDKKLISVGIDNQVEFPDDVILDNVYTIAYGNEVSHRTWNQGDPRELVTYLYAAYNRLADQFTTLSGIYDRIFGGETSLNYPYPRYLTRSGDFGDYISFKNSVDIVGEQSIIYGASPITYDSAATTFDSNDITFSLDKMIPLIRRVITENDFIDISIGYEPIESTNFTPFTFDSVDITYDTVPINFYNIYGENYTYRSILKLMHEANHVRFNDDFILDMNLDRIIIYSINPKISEYYIKSFRLLNLTQYDN